MTELFRHIESLLIDHNCVIIPRLGGFVTQYVAARYKEDEHLFLPPYRSVAFNPQLTLNDGLLVQSYMRVHSTTYPQTVRLIEHAVDEMKQRIQTDGFVELHGIGRLSMDIDGRYDFRPIAAGVTAPELFGLSSYTISQADKKEKNSFRHTDNTHYHFRINRELANYVAAAIVGVLFYLAWALPEHRDAKELSVAASVITPPKNHNTIEQNLNTTDIQPQTSSREETVAKSEANVVSAEASGSEAEIQPAPAGTYTLVLATGVAQRGAEAFISQLKAEGFELAEIVPYRNSKKIIYGTFSTESEARDFASALRSNPKFRDAWISHR